MAGLAIQRLRQHLLQSRWVAGATSTLPLPAPRLLRLLYQRSFEGYFWQSPGAPRTLLPAAKTIIAFTRYPPGGQCNAETRQVVTLMMVEATFRSINLILS